MPRHTHRTPAELLDIARELVDHDPLCSIRLLAETIRERDGRPGDTRLTSAALKIAKWERGVIRGSPEDLFSSSEFKRFFAVPELVRRPNPEAVVQDAVARLNLSMADEELRRAVQTALAGATTTFDAMAQRVTQEALRCVRDAELSAATAASAAAEHEAQLIRCLEELRVDLAEAREETAQVRAEAAATRAELEKARDAALSRASAADAAPTGALEARTAALLDVDSAREQCAMRVAQLALAARDLGKAQAEAAERGDRIRAMEADLARQRSELQSVRSEVLDSRTQAAAAEERARATAAEVRILQERVALRGRELERPSVQDTQNAERVDPTGS